MATTYCSTLLILLLTITAVVCQTFQYSHGWTNGKRSMSSIMEELENSGNKYAGQLDNVLVSCELQKLKLLLQGNHQLLQVPCEMLVPSKRSFSEAMANEHFRRLPTPSNNF